MNKILNCFFVLYIFFFIFLFYNYNNDEINKNDYNIDIINLVSIINVSIFILIFYLMCYNVIIPISTRNNIKNTFYSFSIFIFLRKYPLFIILILDFFLLGFSYITYLLFLLRDKIFIFSSFLFMNSIMFLVSVILYLIFYNLFQAYSSSNGNLTENNI